MTTTTPSPGPGYRPDNPSSFTAAGDDVIAFGFIPKVVTPYYNFASGAASSAILANCKRTLPDTADNENKYAAMFL